MSFVLAPLQHAASIALDILEDIVAFAAFALCAGLELADFVIRLGATVALTIWDYVAEKTNPTEHVLDPFERPLGTR